MPNGVLGALIVWNVRMIKFTDSLGMKRGIEFSLSFCGKYINLTLWAAKNTNGSTVQIPIDKIDELIDNLEGLCTSQQENV